MASWGCSEEVKRRGLEKGERNGLRTEEWNRISSGGEFRVGGISREPDHLRAYRHTREEHPKNHVDYRNKLRVAENRDNSYMIYKAGVAKSEEYTRTSEYENESTRVSVTGC
jgi:hypothetical protein